MARPATVEYGDVLTLRCDFSGDPNNMFWFKDGVYLNENTDTILNITDVTADDGGIYECVVFNSASFDFAYITVYGESYISLEILHNSIYLT